MRVTIETIQGSHHISIDHLIDELLVRRQPQVPLFYPLPLNTPLCLLR